MSKAGFTKAGNIKLGNMWTFSKLYGNQEHFIKSLGGCIKGTCGNYCNGCKSSCYVRKSYRYGSVIQNHATNTIAMRENLVDLFARLDEQIRRAKNKPDTIRINQSGELESVEEFRHWISLASEHKDISFYLYTKAFPLVMDTIKTERLPDNFTVLISVWHEYGLKEFDELKAVPNVKAFVYNDGFNYAENGLTATTKCFAYEGKKLNHNITCDKCRKCFSRRNLDKVIYCDEH